MMGIKKFDSNDKLIMQFYEENYDVLCTPDFDDKTRFLKAEHGLKYLGNPNEKVCRFCGRREPEVSFNDDAHAFPEAIGNKALATYYECDECNHIFGETIETEYCKFFDLYHSMTIDFGKDGKKKCCYKISCDKRTDECMKNCVNIEFNKKVPSVHVCKEVSGDYVSINNGSIVISKPVGKCCPIAVFKTLVKMALTVMPVEEIGSFDDAFKWIKTPEHENFYKDRKLLIRYQFIPGFGVIKHPQYMLYRRKRDVRNKPFMLFNLTYGCFSLLIEVPRKSEDTDFGFENIPFAPIIFNVSGGGTWDVSEKEVPKGMKQSMTLNFSKMTDVMNKMEIKDGKVCLKDN